MALTEDKKTIIEILLFVSELLERLVKELPEHVPENERRSFELAWHEVEPALRDAISQIDRIRSEDNDLWRTLRERGLTGVQLELKRQRLDSARRQAGKKGSLGKSPKAHQQYSRKPWSYSWHRSGEGVQGND